LLDQLDLRPRKESEDGESVVTRGVSAAHAEHGRSVTTVQVGNRLNPVGEIVVVRYRFPEQLAQPRDVLGFLRELVGTTRAANQMA
jgi:hypothetical protein